MVGLSHEECEAVKAFVETLPASFHECAADFIQMGLSAAEVEVIISTAKRSGDEWWKEKEDCEHVAELDANIGGVVAGRGLNAKTKHVTTIRVGLTETEKNALRTEYSCVTDLKFEADFVGRRSDHAFANATRTISKVQLRRMIPTGADVTEVGAKPEDAIMAGVSEGMYYGVMPVLDFSDVNRHSLSVRRVEAMVKRSGRSALKPAQLRVANIFLKEFDLMFTRKKIQDVVRRTDVVLSQDANYDIPMEDCVQFMHRNGSKAWLGSMVRCEQACIFFGKARGVLPMMGFEFYADAEEDTLRFNFNSRSSALPYVHKLSVFAPYQMCDGREFRVGGDTFVYRVLSQTTASQLYFGFFRVPTRPYAVNPKVYVPGSAAGMLKITHPKIDLHGSRKLESDSFLIDQETFARVLRDRLAASTASDEEAIRSIRGARVAVVVNGVRISVDKPVAFEIVKTLASVTQVIAADMKKKGKFMDADVRAALRNGGYSHRGVVSALWDSTMRAVTMPGSFVSLVKDRLGLMRSTELRFSVEAQPSFHEGVSRDVIFLDGDAVFEPTKCYCQELHDAEAMLEGECGGLTSDEIAVLEEYIAQLQRMHCVQCDVAVEQFFDAEEDDSVLKSDDGEADSGYVGSSGVSESSGERVFCGGQQTYLPAEGLVRDAVEEHREILGMQMEANKSEAEVWAKTLLRAGESGEVLRQAEDARLVHEVVKVQNGFVVGCLADSGDPHRFHMLYDYSQSKWWPVSRLPNGQALVDPRASDMLYTNSAFEVWNQPVLIDRYDGLLGDYVVGPLTDKISFVNGIYGCGKTREIVKKFVHGDVYVTATAKSAQRVRRQLYESSPVGRCNVFTFDAAMMHWAARSKDREVDFVGTLYFDEACMTHIAQLFYLMCVMRPRRVYSYGDLMQITWKPFVNGIRPKLAFPSQAIEVDTRLESHRCRLSVVAATLEFYGLDSGIRCCSCCDNVLETEEALERVKIDSLNQVPVEPGVKYLTFTHEDAKRMTVRLAEAGVRPTDEDGHESTAVVSTVHKIQGETYERVVLVRGTRQCKPGSLFFQKEYVNTALTRSLTDVRYYTVSNERDLVTIAMENGNSERYRCIVRESVNAARR